MLDKSKVDIALQELIDALPKSPTWVILLKRDGEFISRIGNFFNMIPPPMATLLEDSVVVSVTYSHAMQEIEMLDKSKHGTFQFSINVGSDGLYIVFHLNDAFLLGTYP